MDERILIRSSLARWPAWLTGTAGFFLLIGGIVMGVLSGQVWLALPLTIGGLVLILVAFFMEVNRVKQLMWLTLEPNRFTVIDNIGERTFADDDIVSVALQYKDNFDNGNHTSTTRTFRVWVVSSADQPELIEMKGKIKVGQMDPLLEFIDRIVKLLKARADQDRLKNLSILGEGWELTRKSLILRDALTGESETPLQEIAAAMMIEDKLKLWKHGEMEAFASIPLSAANAHLLHLLIDEELAKQPQTKKAAPVGELGRIIFERKPNKGVAVTFLVIGAVALIIMLFMLVYLLAFPGNIRDITGVYIGIGVLGVIAILFGLIAWVCFVALFRCHEFGVYQKGIMGEKRLLYSEVEAFNYSATRHYHNGAYIGTQLKLVFIPKKELGKPKLVYSTTVKNIDNSLDQMRDEIASMIGYRLVKEVQDGKPVQWTDNLILEPDLLRYTVPSIFGKNPQQTIAYPMISGQTLHQGNFSFFQQGKPKPVMSVPISSRNFFPGYFAFMTLWQAGRSLPVPENIPVAQVEEPDDVQPNFHPEG